MVLIGLVACNPPKDLQGVYKSGDSTITITETGAEFTNVLIYKAVAGSGEENKYSNCKTVEIKDEKKSGNKLNFTFIAEGVSYVAVGYKENNVQKIELLGVVYAR